MEIYLDETYNALINNSETNVRSPSSRVETTKKITLFLCRGCVSPASRRSGMFSREFRPGKKVMPVVIATVGQISPLHRLILQEVMTLHSLDQLCSSTLKPYNLSRHSCNVTLPCDK